jgi:Bacteriophage CI repressor helix-turn-helix domain
MELAIKDRAVLLNTTRDFLDRLMQVYDLKTDYQLHQLLGVSKTTIYRYRGTGTGFTDDVAIKIARLLRDKNDEVTEGYILVCMARQRAKSDLARGAWEKVAKILHAVAASQP